jgi:hypothetical protein
MTKLIMNRSLHRALLLALALPLTALSQTPDKVAFDAKKLSDMEAAAKCAQTPVRAPVNVAPDPARGFCDAKFLPLTDANIQVAFAETTTRQGLIAFFSKIERQGAGEAIVRAIEGGTPEQKHLARTAGINPSPQFPYAVLSTGRDGGMVGPLLSIRPAAYRDDQPLANTASAFVFNVLGEDFYLIKESCQVGIPYRSTPVSSQLVDALRHHLELGLDTMTDAQIIARLHEKRDTKQLAVSVQTPSAVPDAKGSAPKTSTKKKATEPTPTEKK